MIKYFILLFTICLNSYAQETCFRVAYIDSTSFRLVNYYIIIDTDKKEPFNVLVDKSCIANERFLRSMKSESCMPLKTRLYYDIFDENEGVVRVLYPIVTIGNIVIFDYRIGVNPLTPVICIEEVDSTQIDLQYKDWFFEE